MIGYDWTEKWANYSPEKIAFKEYETGKSVTYRQLNNLANKLVLWISENYGLSFGDRIAVLAENCIEYIALFVAAQKSGLTLVPMNFRLSARELDYMLEICEPGLLIYEEKYSGNIEDPENQASKKIPLLSMEKLEEISGNFIKEETIVKTVSVEIPEDHPILLIFTSGSTSQPKGAMYTHKMLYWNSINTWLRLNVTSEDRALNCTPPFHTGAWNVLQNSFLHHGAYTLLARKFDADAVLQILEEDEHTIFWGVPTMLKMMADSPNFKNVSLKKIRYCVVGGEAMPLQLIRIWHDKDVPIRQGYGLTEVGPNVTSLDHQDAFRKAGSIGKPNFYYDIKIVDKEGKDVPAGSPGEFLLKGPCVTTGYWKNPEETEQSIIDGWFHTGDIVQMDEEGFIFVVDRIKNMYISGGENVYPAEIEHFLLTIPQISEIAIVGVPDEKWGETGKAFVVREVGSKLSSDDILAFCSGKLARYKMPKHFEFVEKLPCNDAGKIDRKALRKL